MPSPDARTTTKKPAPFAALVRREVRALFSSTTPFAALFVAGPLAGVALRGATLSSIDTLAGVVGPTMTGLMATTSFAFPFVVARAFAADKESGAAAMIGALGHRPLAIGVAKALALDVAFALLALPALSVVAAFAIVGGHVHVASLACAVLGHALWAGVVIGVGAVASSFARNTAQAALGTLAVPVALTCLPLIGAADANATSSWSWLASTSSALSPSSLLLPFESGVIEARVAVVLVAIACALVFAGASLAHAASSPEKKAARAIGAVLACAVVVGIAWQVRASVDVSEGRRHSFPRAIAEAMHKIGDPIEVTVRMRGNDPRFATLKRDVLGPLSRAAVVNVERVDVDDRKYGLNTYQVGTRAADSRSLKPDEVALLVLDLAGVRAPPFVDDDPPRVTTYLGNAPLALIVAFGLWPIVALIAWVRARRS